jgi:hypothetical protein
MRRSLILLVYLTVLMAIAFVASAAVPRLINYQGILTDSGGLPIEGNHNLTFKVYPDSQVATPDLWSEEHTDVPVDDGLFNVILGSIEAIPDTLFDGAERWIGVTVGTDPEMTPRMRITSVPWAVRAEVADTVLTAPPLAAHDHDDRYYTEAELSDSGAINTQSNPVDWTKLKSVPEGFADGTDNTGVATAGGWTDDGTVVRLETAADSVGIGTSNPAQKMAVWDNLRSRVEETRMVPCEAFIL